MEALAQEGWSRPEEVKSVHLFSNYRDVLPLLVRVSDLNDVKSYLNPTILSLISKRDYRFITTMPAPK